MIEEPKDLPALDNDMAISEEAFRILAVNAISKAAPFFNALFSVIVNSPHDEQTFNATLTGLIEHLTDAEQQMRAYHEVRRCLGQA